MAGWPKPLPASPALQSPLLSPFTHHYHSIGTIKMKNSSDLSAELALLETSLADAVSLINERPARERAVQHALTANAIGTGSAHQVAEAQAALDASFEAVARRAHLDAAIAELRNNIKHQQGAERQVFVRNIRDEFDREMAEHRAASTALEQSFKRLHNLSTQHAGLAGTPLLYADQYVNFNLFAIRNPNDSPAFSTGTMIAQGSGK